MTIRRRRRRRRRRGRRARSVMHKRHDFDTSFTVTQGSLTMTSIGQGTAASQRIGIKARLQRLELRMSFDLNAANSSEFIRIILIHVKQPNEAQLALGDVLADDSVANAPLSPYLLISRHRYRVIRDFRFFLNTYQPQKVFTWTIPLGLTATYSGVIAPTIPVTNSIQSFIISDKAINGASAIILGRVWFSDVR